VKSRGIDAHYVYLIEDRGKPFDLVATQGDDAPDYADVITDPGLDDLVGAVDGISVDKSLVLNLDADGYAVGASDLVARAQARALSVFSWTLRPENRFLAPNFRRGGADSSGDWQAEFGLIMGTGIDGVFLDHPDLGVAARDALPPTI
jgi:glycerophosphoryl diester phosphodiesterase